MAAVYSTFSHFRTWLEGYKPELMRKQGYFTHEGAKRRYLTRSFTDEQWLEITQKYASQPCHVRMLPDNTISVLFYDEAGKGVNYVLKVNIDDPQFQQLVKLPTKKHLYITTSENKKFATSDDSEARELLEDLAGKARTTPGFRFTVQALDIPEEFKQYL